MLALCWVACTADSGPQAFAIAEPPEFARIIYPSDNRTTAAGLAVGRRLFFDPILSVDSTISCSSCHEPALAFTDGRAISSGIRGRVGQRNSPSLTNVGYLHKQLFWDGRADDLETQALHPIADPNEMGGSWVEVIEKLQRHPHYRTALPRAFGGGGDLSRAGRKGTRPVSAHVDLGE